MSITYETHFKDFLDIDIKNDFEKKIKNYIDDLENEEQLNIFKKFKKIIFTIGGDGTFLEAVHKFGIDVLYIPINQGTLGFYTSWNKDNMDNIMNSINEDNIVEYSMLEIKYKQKEKKYKHLSLNETTLINPIHTQIATLSINDYPLEYFRGTGVCISTPTGSTAYNKSLGGAILNHNQNLFQIVKIAPINNRYYRTLINPIILSASDKFQIEAKKQDMEHSVLTVDRLTYSLKGVEKINFEVSKDKIKILKSKERDFWNNLRKSFL